MCIFQIKLDLTLAGSSKLLRLILNSDDTRFWGKRFTLTSNVHPTTLEEEWKEKWSFYLVCFLSRLVFTLLFTGVIPPSSPSLPPSPLSSFPSFFPSCNRSVVLPLRKWDWMKKAVVYFPHSSSPICSRCLKLLFLWPLSFGKNGSTFLFQLPELPNRVCSWMISILNIRWRVLTVSRGRQNCQQSKSSWWSDLFVLVLPARGEDGWRDWRSGRSQRDVDGFKNLRDGHQHLGKFKWLCLPWDYRAQIQNMRVPDTGIN